VKVTAARQRSPHGALPGNRNIRSNSTQGFSILELMVTLSVAAILATAAMPYYLDAITKRHITSGAEQIATFINTMQGESIKRNGIVSVSYTVQENGSWCIAAIARPTPCECSQNSAGETDFCPVDANTWVLRSTEVDTVAEVSLMSGDGAYAYDPVRGMLVPDDPPDNMILALRAGEGQVQINLSVVSTGLVSLCSPPDSHPIGGIATCPAQL